MGSRSTVGLAMVVRDEAALLEGCVRSARDIVDEVVIADTGSRDETREIAATLADVFLTVPWADSFAEARNVALEKVSATWVLVLDADERIEGPLETLQQTLREEDVLAVRLEVCSDLGGGRHASEHVLRVFRRHAELRYERRVYESIEGSVARLRSREPHWRVPRLDVPRILHTGYRPDVYRARDKRLRNLALAVLQLSEDPNDAGLRQRAARLVAAGDPPEPAAVVALLPAEQRRGARDTLLSLLALRADADR